MALNRKKGTGHILDLHGTNPFFIVETGMLALPKSREYIPSR